MQKNEEKNIFLIFFIFFEKTVDNKNIL